MTRTNTERKLAITISTLVAATLMYAVFLNGSPSQERQKKLDSRRVDDLRQIVRSIDNFYWRHETLPENLDILKKESTMPTTITDPETGTVYEYTKIDVRRYRICANFATASADNDDAFFSHKAGKQCFLFTAKMPDPHYD